MSKNYADLSRRGLIQLNKDFDEDNDGKLLQYLSENGEKYEDIRPIEAIIDRADQACEIIGDSGRKIKAVISGEGGKLIDNVIDVICDIADIAMPEIGNVIDSID